MKVNYIKDKQPNLIDINVKNINYDTFAVQDELPEEIPEDLIDTDRINNDFE